MQTITPAVKHLLIINVIIFIAINSLPMGKEFFIKLALFYPESQFYYPWQIITHMFLHGSLNHILFNMLSLFFIGPLMENSLGTKRFLTYYFTCGFGGAILHYIFQYFQIHFFGMQEIMSIPAVGASGAINGLFIGLAYLFPNIEMMLMFIPIPIKAKYLAIGFLAYDLISGLTNTNSGIAHFAHLGGALFGFLLLLKWTRRF
ncbi:MAG: rhomboid family intramembrane serine protease [Saprospiraceae bacterium]|nr:rhomboid family intramembrane serine protease [Saprospiraceae bacterium]